MHSTGPPWRAHQLEADRLVSLERFREERMREPLEAYLQAFDKYRAELVRFVERTRQ